MHHLGLGKLLFYKDTKIKVRRNSLLMGHSSGERSSLFKDTAMESFCQEPSLDITRYLRQSEKLMV